MDSLGLVSVRDNYEKPIVEFFKQTIKEGNTVLDLGANIGYFTLLAAKLVGDGGKVFAFEPNPESFLCLQKSREVNGFKNIELINKAVSQKSHQIVKFFLSEATSSLFYKVNERNYINVETVALDDFSEIIIKRSI